MEYYLRKLASPETVFSSLLRGCTRDSESKYTKEKVKFLDQPITEGRHTHRLITRHMQTAVQLKGILPNHLIDKLIDLVNNKRRIGGLLSF